MTCFDRIIDGQWLEETLEIKQIPHLQMRKPRPGEVKPEVTKLISGPWEKMKHCLFFLRGSWWLHFVSAHCKCFCMVITKLFSRKGILWNMKPILSLPRYLTTAMSEDICPSLAIWEANIFTEPKCSNMRSKYSLNSSWAIQTRAEKQHKMEIEGR